MLDGNDLQIGRPLDAISTRWGKEDGEIFGNVLSPFLMPLEVALWTGTET